MITTHQLSRDTTTIACKDGVIVYDPQVTCGDVITYDDYEKCLEQGGVKFFCSGAVHDFQRLVDVYFGAKAEGSIDVTALVLDERSIYRCFGGGGGVLGLGGMTPWNL